MQNVLLHLGPYPDEPIPSYFHLYQYTVLIRALVKHDHVMGYQRGLEVSLRSWKKTQYAVEELLSVLALLVRKEYSFVDFPFTAVEIAQYTCCYRSTVLFLSAAELCDALREHRAAAPHVADCIILWEGLPTLGPQGENQLKDLIVDFPGFFRVRVEKERVELRHLLAHRFYSTRFFATVKHLFPLLLEDDENPSIADEDPLHLLLRHGFGISPLMTVSDFIALIPGPYQPITLEFKVPHTPDSLLGTVLNIESNAWKDGDVVLKCPFKLRKNGDTEGYHITIGFVKGNSEPDRECEWDSLVVFEEKCEENLAHLDWLRLPDSAVSRQLLTLLSVASIGLFNGAYKPILDYPRVFTPELRCIAWAMLETPMRDRYRMWKKIFVKSQMLSSTPINCNSHIQAHATLEVFQWQVENGRARLVEGEYTELAVFQLGEYCGAVFAHGCGINLHSDGFKATTTPLQACILGAWITGRKAFRDGFDRFHDVKSFYKLFTPEEVGEVIPRRQPWYPSALPQRR
jgi:hypothetical protein